ncbi:MAG: argininosuccinate lyase [Blastocatellia bacterium]|nr:MAG: argininosuccinate lyase [Blastocatellia bacterium]
MEPKNLWGGRFKEKTDPEFAQFNNSFRFDQRLFRADVIASIAYGHALENAGVLSNAEAQAIQDGLNLILKNGTEDPKYFADSNAEDVHSFVEGKLVDLAGDAGRKLHTGRSRNDQVATDFRLWIRDAIDSLTETVASTQLALLTFAESNQSVVIPGYTHLQRAQPVMLAHWSLAYFEMLARDRDRLRDARNRVNVLPLGSGALSGNSFQIDRETIARELGFDEVSLNSLDAVSDRDFCIEFVSACSLLMVHLSRVAEDIILYASTEFGFFELSDAVATGSSLMPQKKNPDSMELVRGKSGRVFGDLLSLLTVMKGLPLAYNKDMQEDKEAVFDAYDTTSACLKITTTVLSGITVDEKRIHHAATTGYMNATEIADYLVRKGMPFREAHEVVGRVVMRALELNVELDRIELQELRSISALFGEDVYAGLSLQSTVSAKNVIGGTSPEQVKIALARARERL